MQYHAPWLSGSSWHKKPGDAVVRDEVLVEIETDKV
ncbi:hypothetical protein LOS09_21745, partial [Proteus mirabilis]